MGKNDAVIFGSGSREACIAEAFIDYGYGVANVTTDKDRTLVHADGAYALGDFYHDAASALEAVERLRPETVIVQEEALLFRGVATHLRQQGLYVFGADASPSILEQDKAAAREIVSKEFPALLPKLLLTGADPSDLSHGSLPPKYVVRTKNVESPATTVVVRGDASRRNAEALLQSGPVLVEEYIEGQQLTYYVFTDNESVHIAPPLRTYPFRLDQEQGDKTGGMGCVATQRVEGPTLIKAAETVRELAEHIVNETTQNGDRLHCFSIEVIVNDEIVAYIESDVRLGDPEICLLEGLMEHRDLPQLILSLSSSDSMAVPRYVRTDGLSVVIAPTTYPNASSGTIVDGLWAERLNAAGGSLHLGRVKRQKDGKLKLSSSRTGVYTRVGPTLPVLRNIVYDDLESASLPGELSFRQDIGVDL